MEHVTLIGMTISYMMAVGQFVLRQRTYRNTLVGLLFLNLAILISNAFVFYSGAIFEYPHLNHLHLPFMFMSGPALYIFFEIKMNDDFNLQLSTLLHFVPTLVATISLIPYFAESGDEKAERMMRLVDSLAMDWPVILYFASSVILLIYEVVMLKKSFFLFRWQILKAESTAQIIFVVLVFSTLGTLLLNLTFILGDLDYMAYANVVFVGILIGMNVLSRRYPEFFQLLHSAVERARYAKNLIKDLDLDDLRQQLQDLMQQDKIYLQEDITLGEVAARLDISSHQLSQYLNERLSRNFSTYINEYRIADAKAMIEDESGKTILSIAYEVGFNSKSAFNKAFRKIAGMTPTEYRKSLA